MGGLESSRKGQPGEQCDVKARAATNTPGDVSHLQDSSWTPEDFPHSTLPQPGSHRDTHWVSPAS